MKTEDRIIKLTDSLKRQDQPTDKSDRHEKLLEKLIDGQERLINEFHKMNNHLLLSKK